MQSDLQAELKQTRPFRSPLEEAFVGLQRTAAVLEHAFECALKDSGVTATQYNVLRILRGAGETGLCRSEVGERIKEKNLSDALINSLPGIFYVFDETGRFLRWNDNFVQVTGLTSGRPR